MTHRRFERRVFLKTAVAGAGLAAAADLHADAPASIESHSTRDKAGPVTYWMHGFGGDTPADTAKALRDVGFHTVVAGGAAVIEAVHEAGMESWVCGSGFPLVRDTDELKSVDITGKPQIWFGSGSPCCREIRLASLASYAEMVKTQGIQGILVDGVRFASPASGLMPFLTDFSIHAEQCALERGFDFGLMKHNVERFHRDLTGQEASALHLVRRFATPSGLLEWLTRYPGLLEWFRFRRAYTTEHFRALSEIIHGANLRMGIYIFTPSLAPLVGQSYEDLRDVADVFAPMIYRNYPTHPGPACLNWELSEIPGELGLAGTPYEAEVMTSMLAWAGFAGLNIEPRVDAVKTALPPEAVGRETQRARELIGADKELAPIIYIDDPLMADTTRLVREGGADGINFFVFKEDWATLVRPAFSS